jgi:hypothetical protein
VWQNALEIHSAADKLNIVVVPSASPTGLGIEIYSPACWFGERAGVTGDHRDTIAYPATPNATGTIASIPSAAFNIVRSFPRVLTGTVCGLAGPSLWVRG